MGGSSFVLVCPPKTLTWDRNRLCAAASVNVPTLSEYIEADTADWPVTSLPGAAVVVEPGDAQTAVLDGCFAVFKGKLDNYAYLVKKYLLSKVEETELVQDVTLDHIKTAAPIQEAELICELYLELGASLVPKLRGSFSFVCYDSKLVRVLAARSNGSPYPLQQAKALDGSLVLLSGPVPVRCHSVHEIGEGFMKFGWSAEPLRYAPCQEDIQAGVAAASAAVAKALQGIEGSQSGELLTVGSLPVTNMEKAKGKTRRGKRAGVKQRERHSLDGGRSLSSSLGSEYGSLGSVRSMSLDRRTSSTRADEHDWWRAQLRPATAAGVYGSPSVASSVDAESPCAMMSSSAPTQGTAGGFMSRGLSHRAQPFSPRAPKTPRTPKQLNSGLRLIPENLSMHDLRQADEPDESQEMEMELDMDMGIDGAAAQQAQHRQSNFTFCVPTNRAAASPFGPLADASPRPGSGFRHTSGFHAPSSSPASEASSWRAQIPQPREPAPVPNLGSDLGHKPPPVRISPPSYGLQYGLSPTHPSTKKPTTSPSKPVAAGQSAAAKVRFSENQARQQLDSQAAPEGEADEGSTATTTGGGEPAASRHTVQEQQQQSEAMSQQGEAHEGEQYSGPDAMIASSPSHEAAKQAPHQLQLPPVQHQRAGSPLRAEPAGSSPPLSPLRQLAPLNLGSAGRSRMSLQHQQGAGSAYSSDNDQNSPLNSPRSLSHLQRLPMPPKETPQPSSPRRPFSQLQAGLADAKATSSHPPLPKSALTSRLQRSLGGLPASRSAVSLSSLDTSLMGVLHDLPPHVLEKLAGSVDNDAGSMRMLANLMYSSSCGLVITDATQPDMPIVYVNRVFELRTGYSSAEVLGKNCRFLQAPPGEDRVPSFASMSIRKAIESGKGKSVRILNHHKDGSSLWNDLAIAPLRNREGVMTHHVGMQNFSPAEQQAPAPRPLAQPVPIPRHRGAAVAVFDNGMNTGQVLLQRRGSFGKSKSCTDLAGLQPGGLVLSAY